MYLQTANTNSVCFIYDNFTEFYSMKNFKIAMDTDLNVEGVLCVVFFWCVTISTFIYVVDSVGVAS